MADSSNVGKRAIAAIVAKSAGTSIKCKEFLRDLKDVANAPGTNIQRKYWLALFDQFTNSNLDIAERPSATPTGEDIICFLSQLPEFLQSRHESGQLAHSMITSARYHVDRGLAFRHQDYGLSRWDSLHIDAAIQTLLDTNKITSDRVREKQWITCQMIKRLATAVLLEAVQNGTKSWDYTVSSCLALFLEAALALRSGNLKRYLHDILE